MMALRGTRLGASHARPCQTQCKSLGMHRPQLPVTAPRQAAQHAPRMGPVKAVEEPTVVDASSEGPTTTQAFDIQERVEFLRKDLQHLFDEQGIDASAYDEQVEFCDPMTKFWSIQGYLLNIQFLKTAFNPTIELHDIQASSPYSIITRWTMTMEFTPAKVLPTSGLWSPTLVFTGTSTYCFNPANGKINRHIDTWDSIANNSFFSLEAFIDFGRQMLATYTTPKLEQPQFTILRRAGDYEIRQYESYLVAETPMDGARDGSSPAEINPAGAGSQAFGQLARYIFGGNERQEKMQMTTPVFTNTQGSMQFVIGPSAHKDLSSVPAPMPGAAVTPKVESRQVYAVRLFTGIATEDNTNQEAKALMESLRRDGILHVEGAGWKLARYNDPGTLPMFRRNEVLVPLQQPYELWRPGEIAHVSAFARI